MPDKWKRTLTTTITIKHPTDDSEAFITSTLSNIDKKLLKEDSGQEYCTKKAKKRTGFNVGRIGVNSDT